MARDPRDTGDAAEREETVVPLSGAIGMSELRPLRERLQSVGGETKSLRLDLSQVTALDGSVAAVLVALREQLRPRGIEVVLAGAHGRVQKLLSLYEARRAAPAPKAPPSRLGFIEEVGYATWKVLISVKGALSFLGEAVAAFAGLLARPLSLRWSDTIRIAEQVGANGVFIVGIVSLLVGFIIAFQTSFQLKRYGADILIADLVALTIVREMGPLMASLITVARSGSAFTAELGTMKVTEEIDALRALGLSPVRFLVLPRTVAMVMVAPLLTVFSDVIGVLGGLIVAVTRLDLTTRAYVLEAQRALVPRDLILGVVKSAVFGLASALIACNRGLATRGGAEGVGRATTASVVLMIIAVIALDAVFAFFSSEFEI
jgi:phospholipid/cholesterol/gamma-HCH transport system permease protein